MLQFWYYLCDTPLTEASYYYPVHFFLPTASIYLYIFPVVFRCFTKTDLLCFFFPSAVTQFSFILSLHFFSIVAASYFFTDLTYYFDCNLGAILSNIFCLSN